MLLSWTHCPCRPLVLDCDTCVPLLCVRVSDPGKTVTTNPSQLSPLQSPTTQSHMDPVESSSCLSCAFPQHKPPLTWTCLEMWTSPLFARPGVHLCLLLSGSCTASVMHLNCTLRTLYLDVLSRVQCVYFVLNKLVLL